MTHEPSLEELSHRYRTDKHDAHFYLQHYDHHFTSRRSTPVTLLEIGVGGDDDPNAGGESLRMWREYFPDGRIIGVDRFEKRLELEDRITVLHGDQRDGSFLHTVGLDWGPFDIVIDDGSHVCSDVIHAFQALFPYLKEQGVYVIEDLQTSYWSAFGGSPRANRRGTTMSFLKSLLDGLNYAEFDLPRYHPTSLDVSIDGLHFYHNIVFIHKGPNLESSNILPPHPRGRSYFGLMARLRAALSRGVELSVPTAPGSLRT